MVGRSPFPFPKFRTVLRLAVSIARTFPVSRWESPTGEVGGQGSSDRILVLHLIRPLPFDLPTKYGRAMRRILVIFSWAVFCGSFLITVVAAQDAQSPVPSDRRDPFVPTPQPVVAAMLAMAGVDEDDVVYDLGCGDGRMVVTAVEEFGARKGVGVDIDPQRIRESRKNAEDAGVTDRTVFIEDSYFDVEIEEATVLSLYLLPDTLSKLRDKFETELKPGTRIVTHDFKIEGWEPIAEKKVSTHPDEVSHGKIYLWEVPETDSNT